MCLQGRRCPWRLGSMPVHPVQRVQGLSEMTPWTLRFHIPRRQCHRRSLHPAGRYPKDLLAWLSGERKALRADASMATPANAPPPRVSDVSWTSLAIVRTQYTPGFGAVSSGERYPPFWRARWLMGWEFWKSYAADLIHHFPTLQVSSRPRRSGEPGPTSHLVDADEWVPDSAARFRDDRRWGVASI